LNVKKVRIRSNFALTCQKPPVRRYETVTNERRRSARGTRNGNPARAEGSVCAVKHFIAHRLLWSCGLFLAVRQPSPKPAWSLGECSRPGVAQAQSESRDHNCKRPKKNKWAVLIRVTAKLGVKKSVPDRRRMRERCVAKTLTGERRARTPQPPARSPQHGCEAQATGLKRTRT